MKKNIIKNVISLYGLTIAKMIFPLITLPYLTRVLTTECYGVVSYVKAVMQFMQLVVDFGFMYSGTKDIVNAKNNKKLLETENGNILMAKVLLASVSGIGLMILTMFIPVLRANVLYTILSFGVVFLTCFLFDYLFRGLEKMHIITIRFTTMKTIATILTFAFVKTDSDILWIPILDIIGSVIAIILVLIEMKKEEMKIRITSFGDIFNKIKESSLCFASDIATTAFGALNTVLIGIFLTATDVAYWSLCIQLIGAVQSMFTPVINGIYPEMVKNRSFNIVKKSFKIFIPIISVGSIFTIAIAKYVLLIIGGEQYTDATYLLRALVPVLLFSFIGMMLGWPVLGAIGKIKETSMSTIWAAIVQCLGLGVLVLMQQFTLINIAILRCSTEIIQLVLRILFCKKYKDELNFKGEVKEV